MTKKREGIEIITRGVCLVDGHVLLCHGRGRGNTYLPGGHIEKGESAVTALRREIKEEMGVKCSVGRFLGAVEHQFEQKKRQVDEINLLFVLDIPGLAPGKDIPVAEEWLDFRFVRLEELEDAHFEPAVMIRLLRSFGSNPESFVGWGSSYPH